MPSQDFAFCFAEQNARDTQMTTRVTAAVVSRVSRLACTPLTKSEEKERLLAVYFASVRLIERVWIGGGGSLLSVVA